MREYAGDARAARARLRAATAEDHARVDACFARFDVARPDDYRRFLRAQARAYLPVEAAVDCAEAARLVPDWAERRRAAALRQDLADLAIAPPGFERYPLDATPAALLGTIYVLEGSRLGGHLLARRVAEHFPRRFISGSDQGRWRRFVALLDATLTSPQAFDEAIAAARRVFGQFEASAREEGQDEA